ncbi:MAG TPA: acetate--CoA ligase family protein [Actinomycetes bacterium]|nr:acetate--CoA ligase family protein [Actinomycetes bacterium]
MTASGRDAPLAAMLEARSVAVVGASARPGSFGEQLVGQLLRGGYRGAVHPVNPRYRQVLGLPCRPALADLDGPVDLAVLGVGNAALEGQLAAAAATGARAAVIFASCHDHTPLEGSGRGVRGDGSVPPADESGGAGTGAPEDQGVQPLAERLRTIALGAGMAVCGGNGMGFLNLERDLRVCGYPQPDELPPGPVAAVSHSGSAFSALLHNRRGLRFSLVVSSGLELVTGAHAYLEHAIDMPGTRVVALLLETVRQPAALRAALARAAERDLPVVALTLGRSGPAHALVAAHSGALAGADGAWQALLDAYGVARVRSLDELADTCELLAGRRAAAGGLAAVHDSGGERAHLVDLAEDAAVPLARLSAVTTARLRAVLEPGLAATNPVDAWGTGNDADRVFGACLAALADDPGVGAVALCVDLTTEPTPETSYVGVAVAAAAAAAKPLLVLANLASAVDPGDAARLRAAGVPVLEGTATGLAAVGHLLARRGAAARPPLDPPAPVPAAVRDRWRARLARAAGPLGELEALRLLADYGIPVVAAEAAATVQEALAAAGRVGWPVALKTAAPGVAHKTEVGGVRLGLAGPSQLAGAYADLAGRLGPEVLVAAMAAPGVELALGIVRDPWFGPLVLAAAGGVLVELLRDHRLALPPLDAHRAGELLDRLAVRPLLDGGRGAAGAALGPVRDALARLSLLAADLGDLLDAVDVNPLVAGPAGCVAVDALVVPAGR